MRNRLEKSSEKFDLLNNRPEISLFNIIFSIVSPIVLFICVYVHVHKISGIHNLFLKLVEFSVLRIFKIFKSKKKSIYQS